MSSLDTKDTSFQSINNNINISAGNGAIINIQNNLPVSFEIDSTTTTQSIVEVKYNAKALTTKVQEFLNNSEASDETGPVIIGGSLLEIGTQSLLAGIKETTLTKFVHTSMTFIEKIFKSGNLISATQATVNGLGIILYLIRTIIEMIVLYNEKKSMKFSDNKKNNDKIYCDYVEKTIASNFGAIGILLIGSVLIGYLFAALWPAVVASFGFMILAWIGHFGIRKWYNHYKLGGRYYKALKIFRLRKNHKIITMDNINDKYIKLKNNIEEDIVNEKESKRELNNLEIAKKELETYIEIRDKDDGYVKDKVEYYIQNRDNNQCIIL